MALELVLDKTDGLADPIKALYVEKDGKFHLDVNGVEDVSGLKSALNRQKTELSTLKNDLNAWKALGKSADEIAKMIADADAAAQDAAKKSGNIDAVLKQHQDKWTAREKELTTEIDTLRGITRKATIDAGISAALAKAKATSEGLPLLMQVLPNRVKFDIKDGKTHIEILQADGSTPLAGRDANTPADYDDLVKEAVKTYPSLFEGTGAGGGGASQRGGRGAGNKVLTRKEFDAIAPELRAAKIREGYSVVD